MWRLIRVLIIFVALSCGLCTGYSTSTTTVQKPSGPKHDKYVACYFQSWAIFRNGEGAFQIQDIRPEYCTTLIYSFAGLNASTFAIESLDHWADLAEAGGKNGYTQITSLRYKYPHLKVLLAIGGWNEGSKKYSEMARTDRTRKRFIDSVIDLLASYNFQGLDIDWEFPADLSRGGAEYDKYNFIDLLKELKREFTKREFMLTAAISADVNTMSRRYDLRRLDDYLDRIHVMTYDYHPANGMAVLPNAPLNEVNDTLDYLLKNGVSPHKLILGLPTYGRGFVLEQQPRSPSENAIGMKNSNRSFPFKGIYTSTEGYFGYNEICKQFLNNGSWSNRWDNISSTPYFINRNLVVVYDNEKSLQAKVQLAMDRGLGGVFVWSIDTDDFRAGCVPEHKRQRVNVYDYQYPLMRAITSTLERGANGSSKTNPTCIFLIVFAACLTILRSCCVL